MTYTKIQIVLNGSRIEIAETDTISYEELCNLAGLLPEHNPTAIYSTPDGQDGILRHGKAVTLVANTIFNVMQTNNA